MPLIVLCGVPQSGKTTIANKIVDFYAKNHPQLEVVLLNEEKFNINKQAVYNDYKEEKSLRGFFRSNVNKLLSDENVVILDSMNYIKGFRYELFVICRTAKTNLLVLLVDSNIL